MSDSITLSDTTSAAFGRPLKQRGWCEEQGVEHAWNNGPTIATNPPIETRFCVNCGKRQILRHPVWEDE